MGASEVIMTAPENMMLEFLRHYDSMTPASRIDACQLDRVPTPAHLFKSFEMSSSSCCA